MAETECDDIKEAIKAAIEDEHKAQSEYARLGAMVAKITCEPGCPQGNIANIAVMQISKDEALHEGLLRELLVEVERICIARGE